MQQLPDNPHVVYQYEEAVLLRFASQRTGGVAVRPNQRIYFDSQAALKLGTRVVAIAVPYQDGLTYYGTTLTATALLNTFTLTIYDTAGEVRVWQYPLLDLQRPAGATTVGTFGKTRRFDFDIDFKKSFVLQVDPGKAALSVNGGILFNFYTRD